MLAAISYAVKHWFATVADRTGARPISWSLQSEKELLIAFLA